MKLGDITEVGFYKEVDGEDIWECFENTDKDEEWRKDFPLLLDSWLYQYTDENDRKIYECDGLLYKIGYDYSDTNRIRIHECGHKITNINSVIVSDVNTDTNVDNYMYVFIYKLEIFLQITLRPIKFSTITLVTKYFHK